MMRLAIPVALLIIAGAAWWALQPTDAPPPRSAAPASAPASTPARRATPPPPQPALQPEPALLPAEGEAAPVPSVPSAGLSAQQIAASQKLLEREMAKVQAAAILEKVAEQAPETKQPALSADAVKFAIDQAKPGIVDCYEQALEKAPDLAGAFTVRFTIHAENGAGTLRDAEIVADELGNPFLGMCALNAIAKVEFDAKADGVVTVNYPFNLKPSKAPQE